MFLIFVSLILIGITTSKKIPWPHLGNAGSNKFETGFLPVVSNSLNASIHCEHLNKNLKQPTGLFAQELEFSDTHQGSPKAWRGPHDKTRIHPAAGSGPSTV